MYVYLSLDRYMQGKILWSGNTVNCRFLFWFWRKRGGGGAGFEPDCTTVPIAHRSWNCPLKKQPERQIVPFKIWKKIQKKAHKKSYSSIQFSYSCFLPFVLRHLVIATPRNCHQVRRTHMGIFKMSHRKCVGTLDSFSASNQSQTESAENDTEVEQSTRREGKLKGNRRNHDLSKKLGCEITGGCTTKRRWCSAIFVVNLRKQIPLHQHENVTVLESQFSKDKDCKEHEDAANKWGKHKVYNHWSMDFLTITRKKELTPVTALCYFH